MRKHKEKMVSYRHLVEHGPQAQDSCEWTYDQVEDGWRTGCDRAYSFIDGNIQDNGYIYCPNCGKRIAEFTERDYPGRRAGT